MKTFDQHVQELADRLDALSEYDGYDVKYLNAHTVAEWILKEYEPPVEWETTLEDDFGKRAIRVRATIAGEFFEQRGGVTEEQLHRGLRIEGVKQSLRFSLARSIIAFLDRGND